MPRIRVKGLLGIGIVSDIGLKVRPGEVRVLDLTTQTMEAVRDELIALKRAKIIDYTTVAGDIEPELETSLASAIRSAYQNETELANLVQFRDQQVVFVEDGQADWYFDAQSFDAPAVGFVVKPNTIPLANPGRWIKYAGGGAGLFLLRTAGDFATFPFKGAPVATDVLLIEDSGDGGNKKYISVQALIPALNQDTFPFVASRNGVVNNVYLRGPGRTPTNLSGFTLDRNATLTGIAAATNGTFTWTAEIRKNNLVAPIASLSVVAVAKAYDGSLSVDVVAGDEIQIYCNGTNINRPTVVAFFKRRS
jgi:hypothetical protein